MTQLQDSTDVTLALQDGQTKEAHKVMLCSASNKFEFKDCVDPKVIQQLEQDTKWLVDAIDLPHHLKKDKLDETAKKNANLEPFEENIMQFQKLHLPIINRIEQI